VRKYYGLGGLRCPLLGFSGELFVLYGWLLRLAYAYYSFVVIALAVRANIKIEIAVAVPSSAASSISLRAALMAISGLVAASISSQTRLMTTVFERSL